MFSCDARLVRATRNVGRACTPAGSVLFRDSYFALDHRHGRFRLDSALESTKALRDALGASLSLEALEQVAFLDIESGPQSEFSQSFAFVIGIGRFEPFYFHLRQLFHRQGTTVEGLLSALNDLLTGLAASSPSTGRPSTSLISLRLLKLPGFQIPSKSFSTWTFYRWRDACTEAT